MLASLKEPDHARQGRGKPSSKREPDIAYVYSVSPLVTVWSCRVGPVVFSFCLKRESTKHEKAFMPS